ncbi:MAG: hypothetical protein QM638_16170 [Nocardioides sp.]|uniref:hypothetical protein n=1 Tax=Nocardioides sp. TaxID=35761 RepID=UPI0039E63041
MSMQHGPAPHRPALPNVIIAGVTKAGTTSLFGYLAQHPDVGVADVKEVDHYAPLVVGEPPPTLAEYAAHFRASGDHPVLLEASPRYFIGGPTLVRRLVEDLSRNGRRPKVLISLREPVERMWSSYRYKRSKDRLPPGVDFAEFVRRCRRVYDAGLVRHRDHATYRTLATGVYADYLGDWFDELGDGVRVLFFDDLCDAADELRAVCGWLGLDPGPVDAFDLTSRNRTYQPRSQRMRRLAHRVNATMARVVADDSSVKRALRSTYHRLNAGTLDEPSSAAVRAELAAFYAPTLPPLREMLRQHGRTRLPSWLDVPG